MAVDPSPRPSLAARLWASPYLLLTLVALFWAGNAVVGRAARDLVPPFTLALARWSGALLLLAPFAWRPVLADAKRLAAHWRIVLLLGLLGVAAFNALLYSGLHYTTATNSLLIQAAIPPLIAIFAFALFRDITNRLQIAAIVMSMTGVVIVVCQGDPTVLLHLKIGLGDALVLIASAAWAIYTVLLRKRPAVHPLSFLACTFAIAVAAMAPLAGFEAAQGQVVTWGPPALGAMAYVAVFPSLIAYLLYTRGVDLIGPARAGQFVNLLPLFGAVLSVLLLGESLDGYHLLGGGFIIGGIAGFAAAGRLR
jgi:drug/metabolite transporter (DMT)-like permease